MEEWLARTVGLLSVLNGDGADTSVNASSALGAGAGADASTWAPPTSMTLRERKKLVLDGARVGSVLPDSARTSKKGGRSVSSSGKQSAERTSTRTSRAPSAGVSKSESGRGGMDPLEEVPSGGVEKKKLPRVILHVRPPDPAG
jgi:hypothetical protein